MLCEADIDIIVNLRSADAVSEDPPRSSLRNFQYMSQMDNSDVFVALCTPGTFSPDYEGVCHDCTVCRPGEQFERLACIPVRDRSCANCTLCSDKEIELCQCSVKTTQCVTGDRVCVKVVPTSVTLTIDLTAAVVLTSRQQTLLKSGMATGYADWLGEQFGIDPITIELVNFVKTDQLNYKATFTFLEVYGEATVTRIKTSSSAFFQGGLAYTFGSTGRRRLLSAMDDAGSQAGRKLLTAMDEPGSQAGRKLLTAMDEPGSQAGRKLLGRSLLQSFLSELRAGNSTFSCNASQDVCTEPFTEFRASDNGTGCSGICAITCPPGYGAATGSAKCEKCAAGYFKNTSIYDLCTECPAGATSPIGSNSSEACEVPTTTSEIATTSQPSGGSSGTSLTSSQPAPPTQAPASSSQAPLSSTSPPPQATTGAITSSTASSASSPASTGSSWSSSSSSAASLSSTSLSSSALAASASASSPWSSTSPQTTQAQQPPSPSSSPPSAGGISTGTGGSSGSSSASASNSNADRNDIVSTINPTVNSNSDSRASSDSHASNNANNAITVNVPSSGGSQPIFNRNIVNVVLPPAVMSPPRKDYHYDDEYHGPSYDYPMYGYFSPGIVLFFLLFMVLFCFSAAWCALQPPGPPEPQDYPVIRYRLIRSNRPARHPREDEEEQGGA